MDVVKEIPLDDIIISTGQVRVRDVGKEIDELAASIAKVGLLEPIVVCPAEKAGKYEILTGQRRFLAHKQLKKPTIRATVMSKRVDDATAKALSLTENLVRRDLHSRDLIDACTALYKKYGSIAAVAQETVCRTPKCLSMLNTTALGRNCESSWTPVKWTLRRRFVPTMPRVSLANTIPKKQ
jgi:ParB/RepB/Spo0J family partition protein